MGQSTNASYHHFQTQNSSRTQSLKTHPSMPSKLNAPAHQLQTYMRATRPMSVHLVSYPSYRHNLGKCTLRGILPILYTYPHRHREVDFAQKSDVSNQKCGILCRPLQHGTSLELLKFCSMPLTRCGLRG